MRETLEAGALTGQQVSFRLEYDVVIFSRDDGLTTVPDKLLPLFDLERARAAITAGTAHPRT